MPLWKKRHTENVKNDISASALNRAITILHMQLQAMEQAVVGMVDLVKISVTYISSLVPMTKTNLLKIGGNL